MEKTTTANIIKSLSATGRRKTARAYVMLNKKANGTIINNESLTDYFKDIRLSSHVEKAISASQINNGLNVRVLGGGTSAQKDAIIFAILKLAIKLNEEIKPEIKAMGFLLGDGRQVERKKIGLKKARSRYPYRRR